MLFLKKKKKINSDKVISYDRHPGIARGCQCGNVWEQPGLLLSHNVLVDVSLAVVRCYEGAQPGDGEGVAEDHLHIHPF